MSDVDGWKTALDRAERAEAKLAVAIVELKGIREEVCWGRCCTCKIACCPMVVEIVTVALAKLEAQP